MKTGIAALVGLIATLCSTFALGADESAPVGPPVIYHVVNFKFKSDATEAQITEVAKALVALKGKISGVQSLHWGTNVSPEKRDKGFTHCFVLTFANEKDRDAYLVDPAHKAFIALAGPIIDDVMVIDFKSKD